MRPRRAGVFKTRWARENGCIVREEAERTVGWLICTRTYEKSMRGEWVNEAANLFLLHDGRFFESAGTVSDMSNSGFWRDGHLWGGAAKICAGYPEDRDHFVDDASLADRYLKPAETAAKFASAFAELHRVAGLEMPDEMRLPEKPLSYRT